MGLERRGGVDGARGSPVLVFLGGKRDPRDRHAMDCATREFWEESGGVVDLESLRGSLTPQEEPAAEGGGAAAEGGGAAAGGGGHDEAPATPPRVRLAATTAEVPRNSPAAEQGELPMVLW